MRPESNIGAGRFLCLSQGWRGRDLQTGSIRPSLGDQLTVTEDADARIDGSDLKFDIQGRRNVQTDPRRPVDEFGEAPTGVATVCRVAGTIEPTFE